MRITNLGFPNSYNLSIKKTVEGFWKKANSTAAIQEAVDAVTAFNLNAQQL